MSGLLKNITIFFLSFFLIACGGGSSDSGSGTDTTASTSAGSTSTTTTPPETTVTDSEGNEFAGTYVGTADLILIILGVSTPASRPITIVIDEGGGVVITGADQSVSGSLSGNRLSASIPVAVSEDGISCSGNVGITGKIGNGLIVGDVTGSVPCNVGPASLRGTFTAS